MGRINSRQKGASGERELAKLLTKLGFDAYRGRQFSGSSDSPDIKFVSLQGLHTEVKRVERGLCLYSALEQSERDASGKTAIVAHRKNGKRWLVTLDLEVFFKVFVNALQRQGKETCLS